MKQRRIQYGRLLLRITLIALGGILIAGGIGFLVLRDIDRDHMRQRLVEEMYARVSEDPRETFLVDQDAYPVEGEDEESLLEEDHLHGSSVAGSEDASLTGSIRSRDNAEQAEGDSENPKQSLLPVYDLQPMPERSLASEDGCENGTSRAGEYLLTSCGTIQIPSISCSLPVWEGAGKIEMRYGAGHMPYSVLPGENGNCVIYGHRMRAYGSMFNRLGEVKEGDVIRLSSEDRSYVYIVDQIEVISPSLLSGYINAEDGLPRVTLITCTPTGVASHRLIVIGHLRS